MKLERDRWDPYPPKYEPFPLKWETEYLERKQLFKDRIKPAEAPESARALGRELQRARETSGITLDEIAKHTFIKKHYLEAIERGAFEQLPGGLYMRNYVKLYARYIQFDESTVRRAFMPSAGAAGKLFNDLLPNVAIRARDAGFERGENHSRLPKLGEYLLYFFLSKSERVNVIGDLEEDYEAIEFKFGQTAAKMYFYRQVLSSLWPFIGKFILRLLIEVFEEITRKPKL